MSKSEGMDFDECGSRRADVELFIIHPTICPAEITTALGLEAHTTHQVGHPGRTPKGTPLEGQYRDTRWRHSIRYELRGQWIADKIAMLIDRLFAVWQRANPAKRVSAKQDGLPSNARLRPAGFGAAALLASRARAGGEGRTRTFEAMRRLIYSQLPLPLGTLPLSTASLAHPLKWRQEGRG